VFAFVPAALLLAPERRTVYPERKEKLSAARVAGQAIAIFRTRRFWIYFAAMFLAGGGEFCLTFWCASFIQVDLKASALAGGIGTAAFALGMFGGRTGFGFLMRQRHLKGLLIITGIAATLTSMLIPWIARRAMALAASGGDAAWAFPSLCATLFVAGVATAPFWPSIQTYAVERMPHLDSTMMFVLLSCAGIPGCGFFTLLLGYMGRSVGLTASFYLVPACFAVMVALLLADPQRGWRKPRMSP
jgi:Fucose permease